MSVVIAKIFVYFCFILNFNVFLTGCDDSKETGRLVFAHVVRTKTFDSFVFNY